jgi:hypothetical protein
MQLMPQLNDAGEERVRRVVLQQTGGCIRVSVHRCSQPPRLMPRTCLQKPGGTAMSMKMHATMKC